MTKFERKAQENTDGGSVEREVSIHYSNVMSTEKFDEKNSRRQSCASLLVAFRRSCQRRLTSCKKQISGNHDGA